MRECLSVGGIKGGPGLVKCKQREGGGWDRDESVAHEVLMVDD